MPVPASINDLSTTVGSNSPAGTETPTEGDNYLRSLSSFIATLRDQLNGTSNTGTVKNGAFTGTQTGATTWSGLQTFSAGINVGGTTYTSLNNPSYGTYTPTLTGVANVSSTFARQCTYMRVGDIVTVGLVLDVTSTSGGTTTVGVSLPVASALTTNYQVTGTVVSNIGGGYSASVSSDATNDRAQFAYTAGSGSSVTFWGTFQYQVI